MSKKTSATEINLQCIDAIEVSLSIEKEGFVFYDKASRQAQIPEVKEIFRRLADEEKEHIQTLQAKAKFLQPALRRKRESGKGVESFIDRELKGRIFPLQKKSESTLAQVEDDMQALDIGIQSEQRSIEVLRGLLEKERKIDVRAIFSHLMVEEKKHLAALEELKKILKS